MSRINCRMYIERARGKQTKFVVKALSDGKDGKLKSGYIDIGRVYLPLYLIGKRIQVKIEIIKEKEFFKNGTENK